MSADFLVLDRLTKHYDHHAALDGLSLAIGKGQCLVLLGPSGCGKTTTLNIIAGFLEPESGSVRVQGVDITAQKPHRRDMGMVFQDCALFPHMTLLDNVAFGLRMRRVGRATREQQARDALALVGLDGFAARYPAQLSGGQRQRVALARALVVRPRLLLFDEPLSNLDANLRESMRVEIRALLDETGITAVFVTHDQAEAMALADRVALLRSGKLEQFGPPRMLYEQPATRFAAMFLGGCNVLPAHIVTQSAQAAQLAVHDMRLEAPARADLAPGPALLAIRPHHVRLRDDGPVHGTIEAVEYLGTLTRLTVRTPDGPFVTELPRLPAGLGRGAAVTLGWSPEESWLLPADA
jgi:ABC-type Fe3+/spermidine/putrescine transport system ATPase subunit